jgi:hypothetical protein
MGRQQRLIVYDGGLGVLAWEERAREGRETREDEDEDEDEEGRGGEAPSRSCFPASGMPNPWAPS